VISRWLAWPCAFIVLLASVWAEPLASAKRILSAEASAALWTVGPGRELYTAFGHSALRITDPVIGFDRIYNFGTFDFSTPNFYLKFIQGDLDYYLTAAIAPELIEEYQASHQLLIEQKLNLTPSELDELFLAMEDNLQPEQAAYRYDFVRDNCTTRIRDAVAKVVPVLWTPLGPNSPTLRQMVQPYVADRAAIQTGIHLLFGAHMDHPATTLEAMFLPEDMRRAFDLARLRDAAGERRLVASTQILLAGAALPSPTPNWLVLISYTIAGYALWALLGKAPWPRWCDVTLMSLAALIGCFIVFVWFGTRHWVLHENWKLLALWPTHLIVWFLPKRIQRIYWSVALVDIGLSAYLIRGERPYCFLGFFLILALRSVALSIAAANGSPTLRRNDLPLACPP
jgi:hypothetical protein